MTKKRCKILGYNVDLLSFSDSVEYVLEKLQKNEGLHIITINPEIIAAADTDKEFAQIINESELVLPESSGIKSALKFKGIQQEQIPGIDFSKVLLNECAKRSYSVALIGAKEEVLKKTVENLKDEFPNLNIVYTHNGYYDTDEHIIKELVRSEAKLVLCALGAGKQELFIKKCRESDKNGVYIGVGGSFDVWAGAVKRAPILFRKLGLEWAYRTLNEPKRIKRIYKTLPMFLFRSIIESMKR